MCDELGRSDVQSKPEAVDTSFDYEPLEYLIAAIVDCHLHPEGKKRKARIRDALLNLTGREHRRVDEPDSDESKALFKYAELEDENYFNTIAPEHGGPEYFPGEKAIHAMAKEAAELYPDENGNRVDNVYKKVRAKYAHGGIQRDPSNYEWKLRKRYRAYQASRERELQKDIASIGVILKKYNIETDLRRPFWRLMD